QSGRRLAVGRPPSHPSGPIEMRRREFVTVIAAAAPMAAAANINLEKVKTRKTRKVEIVFDSPGRNPKPNGLQATDQGLWIIDQGPGSRAYLVDYDHGK